MILIDVLTNKVGKRLSKCSLGLSDYIAVIKAMKGEMLGMGKWVKEFEERLSTFMKTEVICTNTGTSAIQLALEALYEKGNTVVIPSLTYVATYQAAKAAGYKIISCDVDLKSGNLGKDNIEDVMDSSVTTIVMVLYAGDTKNLLEISEYCRDKNLNLIIDAAHAYGTTINGESIARYGTASCFSFDGIKNITCGEGGCIATNNRRILEFAKPARLLGVSKDSEARYQQKRLWNFDVKIKGYRYHMSNINAALGISQMSKQNRLFKKRQLLAIEYDKKLEEIPFIYTYKRDYSQVVPHIYPIIFIREGDRDKVRRHFRV